MGLRNPVVLVPFPFDDLSSSKVRPAVCLTDEIGEHRHVVVAFITSQLATALETSDIVLTPENADFASTGLRVASAIGLHRLLTVSADIVRRTLGTLPADPAARVHDGLRRLFHLEPQARAPHDDQGVPEAARTKE